MDSTPGRYVTPGGGQLTICPAEMRAHIRITLDHPGCPAQLTDEKDRALKRLALAAEGYCVQSGWRHRAAYANGAYRTTPHDRAGGLVRQEGEGDQASSGHGPSMGDVVTVGCRRARCR
ncbi:DUF6420 family protein [Streptomyces longwoodensis]|uniref:DUF6420 family protein n=1 Tax=Streptomyces longwoodensis TaxID=68231 RepID=UPI003827DA48